MVPVPARRGHPADRYGGLEVEDLGENGGGQSAGEVHQSSPATGHGRDAEAPKPLSESAWVEGTSWDLCGGRPLGRSRNPADFYTSRRTPPGVETLFTARH